MKRLRNLNSKSLRESLLRLSAVFGFFVMIKSPSIASCSQKRAYLEQAKGRISDSILTDDSAQRQRDFAKLHDLALSISQEDCVDEDSSQSILRHKIVAALFALDAVSLKLRGDNVLGEKVLCAPLIWFQSEEDALRSVAIFDGITRIGIDPPDEFDAQVAREIKIGLSASHAGMREGFSSSRSIADISPAELADAQIDLQERRSRFLNALANSATFDKSQCDVTDPYAV